MPKILNINGLIDEYKCYQKIRELRWLKEVKCPWYDFIEIYVYKFKINLINKLVNSSIDLGKVLCIYAVMKTDRLFFEFMVEVYKETCILGKNKITD